jgi:hypothetical protein
MSLSPRFTNTALAVVSLFVFSAIPSFAAASLTQEIDPREVNVGDPAIVTLSVQGGSIIGIQLPPVDGLQVGGTNFQIKSVEENGSYSTSVELNISITPTRPGNFVIPAFDIRTQEGDVLHVKAMKLHALGNGNPPAVTPVLPPVPTPDTASAPATNAPPNPNGPVVMPPANAAAPPPAPNNGNPADTSGTNVGVPRDKDGGPAKVFIIITPQTTDAYVGQAIPMRIDFYIRMDVNADQNSLPTIKGSDFLMNSFTTRGQGSEGTLENVQYGRESWITAISAPKSGDFPLSMERDSYWIKSITNTNIDSFFGGMFGRQAHLAHEMISSNQLTMHIHALPTEGQPPHFTGAIGQLRVTGEAQPAAVEVGEPVTLRFTVSGEGNFDYVRCPALPSDPAWKTYTPRSGTNYLNEARTSAVKTFEQSVIPQRNGTIPLPPATFSYFDPATKQYVTVPIPLPVITVTGSPVPIASTSPDDANDSTSISATPPAIDFLPNRLEAGSTQTSLTPVFRQPWFWGVQSGFVFLPLLGALFLFLHFRSAPDAGSVERARRVRSLQQEKDAMAEAVRQGDAHAFFVAARHAFQLQLGAQWNLKPEAITLREIRSRDPQLAETLQPLFRQADEVIYSGQASPDIDLAEWDKCVRAELLQPQPA